MCGFEHMRGDFGDGAAVHGRFVSVGNERILGGFYGGVVGAFEQLIKQLRSEVLFRLRADQHRQSRLQLQPRIRKPFLL